MSETDNQYDVAVVFEYKIEKGHSWSGPITSVLTKWINNN